MTKPWLALIQCQPHRSAVQRQATWLTLLQRQPGDLVTSICFGSHVSAADTLTLLIKASATVIVYRGHRRTLFFLPGIISLFIMCVGIIRNNSLVGGRARLSRTPTTERVMLYCTWRPSALNTRPQGQVSQLTRVHLKKWPSKWCVCARVRACRDMLTR